MFRVNIFDQSGAQVIIDEITHEELMQFESQHEDSDLSYCVERCDRG